MSDRMLSHHHLSDVFVLCWAAPAALFVLYGWIWRVFMFIQSEEDMTAYGWSMSIKEIAVDEDLPNFFDALKLNQAEQVICEYNNIKEKYGIELNNSMVVDRLE